MLSTLPLSFDRYLQMREGTYTEMQKRKHITIYYPSKACKRPFSASSTQRKRHILFLVVLLVQTPQPDLCGVDDI